MKKNKQQRLFIKTQILIAPGYTFKITNALITNFHQPKSTLLLLVAAITKDWKKIYEYALNNNFRFLSYGDGCLIDIKSPLSPEGGKEKINGVIHTIITQSRNFAPHGFTFLQLKKIL
jgi:hypothetical protein